MPRFAPKPSASPGPPPRPGRKGTGHWRFDFAVPPPLAWHEGPIGAPTGPTTGFVPVPPPAVIRPDGPSTSRLVEPLSWFRCAARGALPWRHAGGCADRLGRDHLTSDLARVHESSLTPDENDDSYAT